MPVIDNLGKLLSLEQQLPTSQTDEVLTQFPHRWNSNEVGEKSWHASEQCSFTFIVIHQFIEIGVESSRSLTPESTIRPHAEAERRKQALATDARRNGFE